MILEMIEICPVCDNYFEQQNDVNLTTGEYEADCSRCGTAFTSRMDEEVLNDVLEANGYDPSEYIGGR